MMIWDQIRYFFIRYIKEMRGWLFKIRKTQRVPIKGQLGIENSQRDCIHYGGIIRSSQKA